VPRSPPPDEAGGVEVDPDVEPVDEVDGAVDEPDEPVDAGGVVGAGSVAGGDHGAGCGRGSLGAGAGWAAGGAEAEPLDEAAGVRLELGW
jgi:hypothetical protein